MGSMKLLTDWELQVAAFDFETSGSHPAFALQPWRYKTRDFWATSLAWVHKDQAKGGLAPDKGMMREMLEEAIAGDRFLLGWNTVFDISVLLAYGLHDLVFKAHWLDGMLLWKEAAIEPEYEIPGYKKKPYGLKQCVAELLPQYANYADDVDFHDTSPEARKKLHEYNVRDIAFTYYCSHHWWDQLTEQQQMSALIKADCLPMVAQANLEGMLIDQLAMRELTQKLNATADKCLATLSEHGVTEKIVRSPVQLSKLMFDEWKLPVLKENTSKKTGNTSRSTDKEVLHELSFKDSRVKVLREYREALNNRKKFAERPLEAAAYNRDGHAHPLAIVFGTYTGRMTYASNQKRDAKKQDAPEAEGSD
jgi:DNA polymerase I-like protein with 3'-5' exonuclease and polymerase domains